MAFIMLEKQYATIDSSALTRDDIAIYIYRLTLQSFHGDQLKHRLLDVIVSSLLISYLIIISLYLDVILSSLLIYIPPL